MSAGQIRTLAELDAVPPGSILCVMWEDSATESASTKWMGGKALRDALRTDAGVVECMTVGFLVNVSRRAVTLAQNISDSNQCSHVIHIPCAALLEVELLREPDPDE